MVDGLVGLSDLSSESEGVPGDDDELLDLVLEKPDEKPDEHGIGEQEDT